MNLRPVPILYVDARCLQDPDYQFRGVGVHVASLLRGREMDPVARFWRVLALISRDLPSLPPEYSVLFDDISSCVNPPLSPGGSIYLDASPMTHAADFGLRLNNHPRVLTAATLYDFIPWDRDGYLPSPIARLDYIANVARLKLIDLFFPISKYTARRLTEIAGVAEDRIEVTGAAIRRSFTSKASSSHLCPRAAAPYFLTVGGGDRRKNTEAAVKAVGILNDRGSRRFRLVVVGRYGPEYYQELLDLARQCGDPAYLEFRTSVDDTALGQLYANAAATIVPSHIEGFSLPVVEAAFCGSPVIASSCDAHRELIVDPEALFSSDDPFELADRLEHVVRDTCFRRQLSSRQQSIANQFCETEVNRRFWGRLAVVFRERYETPPKRQGSKPRIAFLSPYPPERSGIARFTELTLRAAGKALDIDLYTDAPRELRLPNGVRDAGPISKAVLAAGGYDAIISVVGNSSTFHSRILDFFDRYGGPCILHDSRLTHVYRARLGDEKLLEAATKAAGRTCTATEIPDWLDDRNLPSLFVEPILERACPLIVHSKAYRDLLLERYGFHAQATTFPPNMPFADQELSPDARRAARLRLGLSDTDFVISTFGYVSPAKDPLTCVRAVAVLRSWQIPASLYFVGDPCDMQECLQRAAKHYRIAPYVHLSDSFVPEENYHDFLLGSDAAIQLRQYGLEQPSAAVADCASAGLPAVATEQLAAICEAPAYVRTVPPSAPATRLAELLAVIWQHRDERDSLLPERKGYLETHNFEYYARRLREILRLS